MQQRYTTDRGLVKWHWLDEYKDYYEFAPISDPIYLKARVWCALDLIKASVTHIGYGRTLLREWLSILPPKTGIVCNPFSLLPDKIPQAKLEQWYLNQGFSWIPYPVKGSMYFIK